MARKFFSLWSRGIFVMLLPALLLLPTLHLHPAVTHEHGTQTTHAHAIVVHTDFFLPFAHDHDAHPGMPEDADDPSSHHPPQIDFSTLRSRPLTLFLPVFGGILGSLPAQPPVLSLRFAVRAWLLARDHLPPLHAALLSPSVPRSPPRFA